MNIYHFPDPQDHEAIITQAHNLVKLAELPMTSANRREIALRALVLAELAKS